MYPRIKNSHYDLGDMTRRPLQSPSFPPMAGAMEKKSVAVESPCLSCVKCGAGGTARPTSVDVKGRALEWEPPAGWEAGLMKRGGYIYLCGKCLNEPGVVLHRPTQDGRYGQAAQQWSGPSGKDPSPITVDLD
jgi:hypothetical protein